MNDNDIDMTPGGGQGKGEGGKEEKEGSKPGHASAGTSTSIEARLRRLEEIVQQLESEEVELERSLALFEEGVRLASEVKRALEESRLRVKQILGGEEVPFNWKEKG